MTDLAFVGIALLGFTIVGSCFLISCTIKANAIRDRERIEERFAKQVADAKREADSWRLAFEEQRVENIQLKSRLDIQNLVYGKVKVKELGK